MTSTRSSRKERKNSQFRRVFWWQMKHNRIFTGFYAVALLSALSVGTLCFILLNLNYYTDMSYWEGTPAEEVAYLFSQQVLSNLQELINVLVLPISILYIFCYCWNAFGYMQSRRSVDLFHALPIRRRPLLMGSYMAGLVTLYVPLAVSLGVVQIICGAYHLAFPISPLLFLETFGLCALILTACYTFTAFFVVVTGTLVDTAISILAVAVGWPLLCCAVDQTMILFLPGYVSRLPDMVYTALCPYGAAFTIFHMNWITYADAVQLSAPDFFFEVSTGFLVWWVCFTVFFLAATILCYSRRKSECAENNHSFPVIRGAVRFLVSTMGGLGLAAILGMMMNYNSCYLAGIVVGSLGVHIVFQAISGRGFRKFWKTVPAYVLTLAVSLGFLYTLYEGGLGYVTRIPDPEQVVKVDFSIEDGLRGDDSKDSYLASYAFLEVSSDSGEYWDILTPSFSEKEDIAAICALHQSVLEKYPGPYLPCTDQPGGNFRTGYYIEFTYTYGDGRTMVRSYMVPVTEEDTELLASVANVQKLEAYKFYEPFYYTDSSYVTSVNAAAYTDDWNYDATNSKLTPEEKDLVWDTFVEELNSPNFSDPVELEDFSLWNENYAVSYDMTSDIAVSAPSEEEWNYTINVGYIKFSDLPADVQAKLDELTPDKEASIDILHNGMYYTVPECCEKTRALIDQLTEEYGKTYYYDEEQGWD